MNGVALLAYGECSAREAREDYARRAPSPRLRGEAKTLSRVTAESGDPI